MARSSVLKSLQPARVARRGDSSSDDGRRRRRIRRRRRRLRRRRNRASDVWGSGITLIEALTAEMPYGDEATWDSRRRIPLLHRRPPKRPAPIAGVPSSYDEMLRACLDPDPAGRPSLSDVREVLTALLPEAERLSGSGSA